MAVRLNRGRRYKISIIDEEEFDIFAVFMNISRFLILYAYKRIYVHMYIFIFPKTCCLYALI